MSKFLTVKEVAEILVVSERTVRNLCQRGDLPHVQVGAVLRIDETDLLNYIKSNKKEFKNNDEQ